MQSQLWRTAFQAAVSRSIPGRVGIFNKKEFLPDTRRDGGAELQSLVSFPNMPGLNSKSLCSPYDLKLYVLLIEIRPYLDLQVSFSCRVYKT